MADVKKIYLVSDGEYSDYHIVAAFSTRERADAFAGAYRDPDVPVDTKRYSHGDNVEEYVIDDPGMVIPRWVTCYCVNIDLESGRIGATPHREEPFRHMLEGIEVNARGKATAWPLRTAWTGGAGTHYPATPATGTATSYVSEAHARKLAAELRQSWLRNNKEFVSYTE